MPPWALQVHGYFLCGYLEIPSHASYGSLTDVSFGVGIGIGIESPHARFIDTDTDPDADKKIESSNLGFPDNRIFLY